MDPYGFSPKQIATQRCCGIPRTSDAIATTSSSIKVLILALAIAGIALVFQDSMLRNVIQSFTSSSASRTMPKLKTPPAPTLPTAIKSRDEAKLQEGTETAVFANGCFWGTEHFYKTYYGHLPQFTCVSGYTGGEVDNPSYRQVCSGTTGHAESVKLTYQKGSVGYGELVEFHLRTHDPTTPDRQGPDRGSQYRSAIFYTTPEQKEIAEKVIAEAQEKYVKGKIVTQLAPLKKWYNAEDYHQDYLFENPNGYHCPSHHLYW